jgi:alkylation response protein AidB-like acyl-CoA dehydrogenase
MTLLRPAPAAERELVEARLDELLATHDPAARPGHAFLGAQYDAGLAWVHFAPGFGGLGVSAGLQHLVDERLQAAGAPNPWENFIGIAQSAAAIHGFGTQWQKERLLRPAFANEEIWCQLFSEPGAGSDLAGLSTAAVRDGDVWVVNGQKVWTSYARNARWAILLARTDPDVPKHRGLTFFICDMEAPGVDVRPLRQADGTDRHFNEVFLTDVHLPDQLRVGEVGQGWAISVVGLSAERDGQGASHRTTPIQDLMAIWAAHPDRTSARARVLRDRVARLWIRAAAVDAMTQRMKEIQDREGPKNEGALTKIASTELAQAVHELGVDILGPEGQLGGEYATMLAGVHVDSPQLRFVRSRAMSIEGGSNQILRNIVGERVLGLPGDIRVDKSVPWRDVPRS